MHLATPSRISTMCRGSWRQIELCNLGAGGAPHALMATDVFERGVERPDAMGYAADIGVQRNRKYAAGIAALAIQHIKSTADHVAELARRRAHAFIGGFVVGLLRIRHPDQAAAVIE